MAGPMDVSPPAIWTVPMWRAHRLAVLVYALVDVPPSPAGPLGDSIDVFVRREDAERFVEEIRGDALATFLRIEERELEAGGETS